jgi:hypothetical protein
VGGEEKRMERERERGGERGGERGEEMLWFRYNQNINML